MDKILDRNPTKSKVIGRCWGDEKKNDHAESTKDERKHQNNPYKHTNWNWLDPLSYIFYMGASISRTTVSQ